MNESNKLKIVGMDPSMSNWGIVKATLDLDSMTFQVDALQLVSTEPEKDKKLKKVVRQNSQDLERARILHKGMLEACEGAWIAMAEIPHGSQSARAMASYGLCIGVLSACPIPLIQLTSGEVKLAGAGVKTATKEEMIEWAAAEHPEGQWLRHTRSSGGKNGKGAYNAGDLLNSNEHLADACAAIKAGILTDQFKQVVSIMRGSRFAGFQSAIFNK